MAHVRSPGNFTLPHFRIPGLRPLLLSLSLLGSVTGHAATSSSDPVLAAHDAYASHDLVALQQLAEHSAGQPLGDYIQFWWIEARLGSALRLVPAAEVRRFIAATSDGPLSERLRADWLKALAQQQAWSDLLIDGSGYAGNDPDVLCGLATARPPASDADIPEAIRALWLSGRATSPLCEPWYARLLAADRISVEDVFTRLQRALQNGSLAVARSTAAALPVDQALPDAVFAQVASDPAVWLEHTEQHGRGRAWRLLEWHALGQIAKSDPARARALWDRVARTLAAADRAQGWLRIAVQAAQRLDPEALQDFRRARDASFGDSDLEWNVRAALRPAAWEDVLRAIDQMSDATAAQPAWRYWRARALKGLGRREEAQAAFTLVGHETEFYGQLATEELGQRVELAGTGRGDPDDAAQLRQRPAMQRAVALFRLGLQPEALKEWAFALRGATERQWLAASEVARQADWFDRMISAAERAGPLSDPALRYPLPFREAVHARAHDYGLDEAWVYGLVRQESRFLVEARSRSGAQGLMQLMPTTARWVARKMGMQDFKPARVEEVQTNLQLGSFYLHQVLTDLGNPVLATAAYNAGPGRVRRWLEPRMLDGAVFCETIPLAETRDYVQKVMANANLYAQRLGLPSRGLKVRIGTIKGQSGLPGADGIDADTGFDRPPATVAVPTGAGTVVAAPAAAAPVQSGVRASVPPAGSAAAGAVSSVPAAAAAPAASAAPAVPASSAASAVTTAPVSSAAPTAAAASAAPAPSAASTAPTASAAPNAPAASAAAPTSPAVPAGSVVSPAGPPHDDP